MMFTYGHTESYEQLFSEISLPHKLGKRDDYNGSPYAGGIVFLSLEEASKALPKGYSVYGLDTELSNTYIYDGSNEELIGLRLLIEDAVLIKIS